MTVIGSTVQWRRRMPVKRIELKFWVDVAMVFVQWSLTLVTFVGSWGAILGLIRIYVSLKKYIYYVTCNIDFSTDFGRFYKAVHTNLRLFCEGNPHRYLLCGPSTPRYQHKCKPAPIFWYLQAQECANGDNQNSTSQHHNQHLFKIWRTPNVHLKMVAVC